jgi:hypothetical protein
MKIFTRGSNCILSGIKNVPLDTKCFENIDKKRCILNAGISFCAINHVSERSTWKLFFCANQEWDICVSPIYWDRRMLVGFTSTYAISAYHHMRCEFEPRYDEMYSIQHSYNNICCPCYMPKYVPRLEGIMHSPDPSGGVHYAF